MVPLVWELTQGWAAACVFISVGPCCLLLQYLIQSCAPGGRRIVEDMCYEIRRTYYKAGLFVFITVVQSC
jgi:hypothetical protein